MNTSASMNFGNTNNAKTGKAESSQKWYKALTQSFSFSDVCQNPGEENLILKCMKQQHLSCSVCMTMYIKPITLGCGHSFCQICIYKSVQSTGSICPYCRRNIRNGVESYDVNIALDQLCQTYFGKEYIALREMKEREFDCNKKCSRMKKKNYLFNRIPFYQKLDMFLNTITPYLKVVKIAMTIITPIFMIVWFLRRMKNLSAEDNSLSEHISVEKRLIRGILWGIINSFMFL